MTPKPFGFTQHRARYAPYSQRTVTELAEQVLREATLTSREEARQQSKYEFENFCTKQRARIAAGLAASVKRINQSRWGDGEGDGYFSIASGVTTAVSKPHKRKYWE